MPQREAEPKIAGRWVRDCTNQKRLPRKEVNKFVLKKIGAGCEFSAVEMTENFRAVDEWGMTGYYKHGDFLVSNHPDREGPRIFGLSRREMGKRWIEI